MNANVDYKAGFQRGFSQLSVGDAKAAREELLKALGVNNEISFYNYRRGDIEPKASQAAAVEAVFHKYGITDIWGK